MRPWSKAEPERDEERALHGPEAPAAPTAPDAAPSLPAADPPAAILSDTTPQAARGGTDWSHRLLWSAMVAGLGIAVAGQLTLNEAAADPSPATSAQQLAAVLYSGGCWTVLSVSLALLTRRWLGSRLGRWAAVALCSLVLGALSLLLLLGIFAKVVTGSFLTLQALQFVVGSSTHFLQAAEGAYRGWALLIGLGALSCFAAFGGALYPAARRQGVALRPRALAATATCALVLVLAFVARSRSDFLRGMFGSSPLLVLASSVAPNATWSAAAMGWGDAPAGDPPGGFRVPDGPSLTAAHAWSAALPADGERRPNVLLLVVDSISAHSLGVTRSGVPVTPNLDRLASESLRMRRAWTTSTHSNYAQMALLSSLLPVRLTGLDQYERLDYPRFLFHDLLHGLGYDTATISSQDETWQGMLRFQSTGTPTTYRHSPDHAGPHIDTGAERIVPDDLTVNYALEWLRQPRTKPWALYLNLQAPHFPYPIPDWTEPRFGRQEAPEGFNYFGYPESSRPAALHRYANALAFVDQQVGRLRRALEQSHELDRTLWIVTADHGELFGEHGLVTHGRSLYDAEARIPLFVRMAGRLAPADDYRPVSHIDVLPTIAALLGVPPHPSFQGESFVSSNGEPSGHPVWLTIQGLLVADAIVCWPWKLLIERSSGQTRLYRLDEDPEERSDQLASHPQLAYDLGLLLDAQRRAQLAYHEARGDSPHERFAPRLAHCPAVPGAK